jgi:soluble lytic murein transglycosylase-like protein/Zn-dependent protease with chaperone function
VSKLPIIMQALGWTLIHMLWQGALIGAALGATRLLLRRATAETRYGVALAALVALTVLPLGSFLVVWTTVPVPDVGDELLLPGAAYANSLPVEGWGATVPRWMPLLLGLWGAGVGLLAIRSVVGWATVRRLLRNGAESLEVSWQKRFDQLRERVGIRRPIRVLATLGVTAPIVTGCWRPTVLLPLSAFSGLPVDHLEALILHELLHVKRWDLWVQRVQLVLETLFFYHPVVWWTSHLLNAEREFCCDAGVVSLTGDRLGYARALTGMESIRAQFPQQALASNGGSLMSRIRNIVQPDPASPRTRLSAAALSLATLGLVVALIATTNAIGEDTHAAVPEWMPDKVLQWSEQFEQAGKRHGVDPALLSIMILLESGGNPKAVSSGGAVGLMQVMPATALRIARDREIQGFDVESLVDPELNIDFGAWYLAQQIKRFGDGSLSDKTVTLAAAAYNGGPKHLRAHIEEGKQLSAESDRYSRLVSELWRDRDKSSSPTLDRLARKTM